jgi:hypothetical protein
MYSTFENIKIALNNYAFKSSSQIARIVENRNNGLLEFKG